MGLTAVLGAMRSGKSLQLLAHGCWASNMRRANLVTNFALDLRELRRYAGMKKYGWLGHIIDLGRVKCIPCKSVNDLTEIFLYENSVILVDEAGIFFGSRDWTKIPKDVLADLCQIGKGGKDVIWCSQFDEQVDKSFRMLSTDYIYCRGLTMWDRYMKRDRLTFKRYYYFQPEAFSQWWEDKKARRDGIQGALRTAFMYAKKVEWGTVTAADIQLFKCFSSFSRLDSAAQIDQRIKPIPAYQQVTYHELTPACTFAPSFEPAPRVVGRV